MGIKHITAAAALAVPAIAVGAAMAEDAPKTFRSCDTVFGQEVCTWVVMEGAEPLELGATVPIRLVESVPADAEMVWPPEELGSVDLPPEAQAALGVDHLAIGWEAHGHPPALFMTPHFDFHFYNVTRSAVAAIDCSDATKPSETPARYTLPDIDIPGMGTLVGLCVPAMGMHAMPDAEVEATTPFEASMLVGYYGGDPIFIEPMVSRERLLQRADFSLPVPAIHDLPQGVRYPRALNAVWDESRSEYRLVLTGFGTS